MFFQIIIVISDIIHHPLSGEIQDPRRGLVDKITVMGDIEHGSAVVAQRVLQNLLRCDIQMVCRLIEDQEVRLGEHELCKRHTSSLTAAQIPDPFKHVIPGEQERRQRTSDLCVGHSRICVGDLLKQRLFHVQDLMILIIIADVDSGTQDDLTGIRLHETVDDL